MFWFVTLIVLPLTSVSSIWTFSHKVSQLALYRDCYIYVYRAMFSLCALGNALGKQL